MPMDNMRKFYLFVVVFFTITGLVIAKVIKDDQFCDLTKIIFGITVVGYGVEYTRDIIRSRNESRRGQSAPSAAANPQTNAASADEADGAEK